MKNMTIEQIRAQQSCPSKRNRRVFTHVRQPTNGEKDSLAPQAQQILMLIKQHGPIDRANLLYHIWDNIRTEMCVSRLLSAYTKPMVALGLIKVNEPAN